MPLLAGFLAACAVQVGGGVLLLWPRPLGIVVSVVGILLGAPFWWGFNLPFAWLDATRRGDYAPAFDNFADDIVMENGPGAGPWHRARGKDDLALMLLELAGSFGDTFH